VVFSSQQDVSALQSKLGDSVHVRGVDLTETETSKAMESGAGNLPASRNMGKDTRNYMRLINTKPEFIFQTAREFPCASHYMWIDAGLEKVIRDPANFFPHVKSRLNSLKLSTTAVLIPGCHSNVIDDKEKLFSGINWRFCGGVFVVPHAIAELFFRTCLKHIHETSLGPRNMAMWEVNIWQLVEIENPTLIEWTQGNYTEDIFRFAMHK
jgi:hypothetical protein